MRIWSLHPKYLDPQGLVALWRETLLAQAVLREETKGYKNHPQLQRFKEFNNLNNKTPTIISTLPLAAISNYLEYIWLEAQERGYTFNRAKIAPVDITHNIMDCMTVTTGQIEYEWQHLLHKLALRNPDIHQKWIHITHPEPHPIFSIIPGAVATWEKLI